MHYGLAGLAGALAFVLSVVALQLSQPEIDWARHYVSEFANGRFGWVFIAGAAVHGLGNAALSVGLRRSLGPGARHEVAALLLGAAAMGMLVAAAFPTDPAGQAVTLSGVVHRTAAMVSFPIELVALYLFSAAFVASPAWRRLARASFTLTSIAALTLTWLILAVILGQAPGLAERSALAAFLAWELGASITLIRCRAAGAG